MCLQPADMLKKSEVWDDESEDCHLSDHALRSGLSFPPDTNEYVAQRPQMLVSHREKLKEN